MGELAADLTDVIAGKMELKYSFSEEAMEDLRKEPETDIQDVWDAMRALNRENRKNRRS